jgi:hypothetical protein
VRIVEDRDLAAKDKFVEAVDTLAEVVGKLVGYTVEGIVEAVGIVDHIVGGRDVVAVGKLAEVVVERHGID